MTTPAYTFGFIGLGAMGVPMVERLLDLGHEVLVWNRTASRCDGVVARGARRADSAAQAMQLCDLVGICLADGAAVEAIASGHDGLLAAPSPRARCIVDFSTIDPTVEIALSDKAQAAGIGWVDCPVSGGVPAARNGTLIGFVGGNAIDVASIAPLTDALFARLTVMGGAGAGQLAKLCNQVIVASNMLVIAEVLATARALGMDAGRLPQALADGFADSKPLQIFGPRMAAHVTEPRMGAIGLMRKDVHLALAQGRARGIDQPMAAHAAALYDRFASATGMSLDDDISSLIRLFEPADIAPIASTQSH